MNLTEEELETSWRDQETVLSDLFNGEIDLTIAAQKLAAIVLPEPRQTRTTKIMMKMPQ